MVKILNDFPAECAADMIGDDKVKAGRAKRQKFYFLKMIDQGKNKMKGFKM